MKIEKCMGVVYIPPNSSEIIYEKNIKSMQKVFNMVYIPININNKMEEITIDSCNFTYGLMQINPVFDDSERMLDI